MILYHGSSIPNLTELKPHTSEHKEPYVYLSSDIVVAMLYTVHKIERPHNWFTYGFDENNIPVYTEYYPNALADVYNGKKGYVYQCHKTEDMSNPTDINCTYVCTKPVMIDKCIVIDDVYKTLLEYEKSKHFIIRRFEVLSDKQPININAQIKQEIINHGLLSTPESGYSKFIQDKFPEVWNAVK